MMYRILNNLYVGTDKYLPIAKSAGYSLLGACKDPLHRQKARLDNAVKDGYIYINKDQSEYLFAERPHALYLNLIDGTDYRFIADKMIDKAIAFICQETTAGRTVFIACNQAESRSPSIAFMFMIYSGLFDDCEDFEMAYNQFQRIYPFYAPKRGMLDYTRNYFEKHRRENDGKR